MDSKEIMVKVLTKKAKGYTYKEKTDEFSFDGVNFVLTKRKVVTKHVAPDISAVKALLEMEKLSDDLSVENLTDQQLQEEKIRLIGLLGVCEKVENNQKENNDD